MSQTHTIKCLIGLGNKGSEFTHTRHNLGKDFVEWLVEKNSSPSNWKKESSVAYTTISLSDEKKLMCIIPQTFMNESGAVIPFLKKIIKNSEEILVAHDDLEINFGECRFRMTPDRGLRGHNGLRSIQQFLKDKPYFLSLGIGRPESISVSDYVLKKFNQEEIRNLPLFFEKTELELLKII